MSRTLSNVELEDYYEGNPYWGGCWMKDEFKRKKLEDKFYIVNLDDASGPGTHWTLVFNVPIPDDNPDLTIYFDAYGVYPPPDILRTLKQSHRPIVYTCDQYQGLTSSQCGYYCIHVANQLLLSVKYEKLFNGELREHQIPANEKLIAKIKLR